MLEEMKSIIEKLNEGEEIELPFIPLRGVTLLPHLNITIDVARERTKEALDFALDQEMMVFVCVMKDPDVEFPNSENCYKTGCVAKVKQVVEVNENGVLRVSLEGLQRAVCTEDFEDVAKVTVRLLEQVEIASEEEKMAVEAGRRVLSDIYRAFTLETNRQTAEAVARFLEVKDHGVLLDKIASQVLQSGDDRQTYLEKLSLPERIEFLVERFSQEIQFHRLGKHIEEKVRKSLDQSQKEYFLREQLRVISEELGDGGSNQSASEEYLEKLEHLEIAEEYKLKLRKEIDKLRMFAPQNPESAIVRNYLDMVFDLPWGKVESIEYDVKKIKKQLDKDHYGLKDVKERMLEFIAVQKLRISKGERATKGPILCLVGPPGVGKTSIASSIAAAMGRPFVRMSLGGVRDEAEIRGHRKTYIGAMPGRLINAMIQAGTDNPLILMDEIDKMASDFRGDPASALLEVLDPEQNNAFRDHYLEIPYDLSQVLFITTANRGDFIPPALIDRMEIIELNGYTSVEKYEIAKRHLMPKQIRENALISADISISKAALMEVISNYTAEAGVRQLERMLAKICRKAALELAMDDEASSIRITPAALEKYAGKAKYHYDKAGKKSQIGLVRGLAWTAAGGDTLEIEASVMPGAGKISITGQLGDVMKESCQVAWAYIRAKSASYEIDSDFFEKHDIHIHVPEGAVPKDGPSAGITLLSAMLSAVTKQAVEPGIAMTGELTLRGRVLPIGGLKEKLIAADRAGIKTVLIPAENKKDISEVPEEVCKKLQVIYVDKAEDVLEFLFG